MVFSKFWESREGNNYAFYFSFCVITQANLFNG